LNTHQNEVEIAAASIPPKNPKKQHETARLRRQKPTRGPNSPNTNLVAASRPPTKKTPNRQNFDEKQSLEDKLIHQSPGITLSENEVENNHTHTIAASLSPTKNQTRTGKTSMTTTTRV
jgi:hypothetical protein